jgi:hypothetical protein
MTSNSEFELLMQPSANHSHQNQQKDSHQSTDSDWPSHLSLSERIEDLKLGVDTDGLRGTDTEKRGWYVRTGAISRYSIQGDHIESSQ